MSKNQTGGPRRKSPRREPRIHRGRVHRRRQVKPAGPSAGAAAGHHLPRKPRHTRRGVLLRRCGRPAAVRGSPLRSARQEEGGHSLHLRTRGGRRGWMALEGAACAAPAVRPTGSRCPPRCAGSRRGGREDGPRGPAALPRPRRGHLHGRRQLGRQERVVEGRRPRRDHLARPRPARRGLHPRRGAARLLRRRAEFGWSRCLHGSRTSGTSPTRSRTGSARRTWRRCWPARRRRPASRTCRPASRCAGTGCGGRASNKTGSRASGAGSVPRSSSWPRLGAAAALARLRRAGARAGQPRELLHAAGAELEPAFEDRGLRVAVNGKARRLLRDCLSGAWRSSTGPAGTG